MSRGLDRSAQSGILIVGAGLAGLTFALSLAKLGIKSTVIEKQDEIAPSRWAILLYPVGMKIFRDLGVLEEVKSLAMPLKDPQVETSEGKVLSILQTGLLFEDLNFCLAVGPSEIREVLRGEALASGVEVLEGMRFIGSVRSEGKGSIIGARVLKNGEESTISSRLLVGADGYKSRVREDLGVGTESRKYPPEAAMFVSHEHGLDRLHMVLAGGYAVVLLPISPNRVVCGLIERRITYDEMIGRGEEFVKKRIGAAVPLLSSAIEACDAKFGDQSLLIIKPEEIWAKTYTVDGGALIGDAAHAFHPGAGQGAQQSFLDAVALAPIVQRCLSAGDFPKERLMEFERPRQALIRFWKANSRQLVSMETAESRLQKALRNRYMRKAGELSKKKEAQEVLWGLRPPSRTEVIRLGLSLFL